MIGAFVRSVVDFILPPRRTQRIVEALTHTDLAHLAHDGRLPYHQDEVSALVWELKYYGNTKAAALAGEFLADELLALAGEELGAPLLIPVPMHQKRRRERGHNHTELLCEATLIHLGSSVEHTPNALMRIKLTPEQQKLDRAKRLRNVAGSMEADPIIVRGRVCIVVDDVTTTGATLAEAKRALMAAGAARVHLVALAQS